MYLTSTLYKYLDTSLISPYTTHMTRHVLSSPNTSFILWINHNHNYIHYSTIWYLTPQLDTTYNAQIYVLPNFEKLYNYKTSCNAFIGIPNILQKKSNIAYCAKWRREKITSNLLLWKLDNNAIRHLTIKFLVLS